MTSYNAISQTFIFLLRKQEAANLHIYFISVLEIKLFNCTLYQFYLTFKIIAFDRRNVFFLPLAIIDSMLNRDKTLVLF